MADRLRSTLRDGDRVGRFGGDEFLVICPGVDSADQAREIAERIATVLTSTVDIGSRPVKLRASVGVAWTTEHLEADTLIAWADSAMYESKRRRVASRHPLYGARRGRGHVPGRRLTALDPDRIDVQISGRTRKLLCELEGTRVALHRVALGTPTRRPWGGRRVTVVATDRQLVGVLSEFARTMASDYPIQGILDHLVRRIVDILPVTGAGVTLISSTTSPHDVAASDAMALRFEKLQTESAKVPASAPTGPGKRSSCPTYATGTRSPRSARGRSKPGSPRCSPSRCGTTPASSGRSICTGTPRDRSSRGDMESAQTLADVTVAYLANAQARSELQDASEQFHSSSLHDPLTGLPNRLLLLERLEHALLRSLRSRDPVAILFVDLDRFKLVNDSHGHLIGDELLVAVADRMASLIRPGDTLARLSGDEFVVVCEAITKKLQIHMIARRIVEALGSPFPLDDVVVEVSASVGIAFSTPKETDPEELLREADIAMYQAKRRGGGTHQVVDVREQGLAERMVVLQRDLALAAERGELRTEYQPIVRICDGRILGAEALLRWDHPSFGLIPPTTLIPLAEQSGAINDIGRWVLERACPDLHRWGAGNTGGDGPPHAFGMAVNVSAHQLMAPEFVATVAEVLEATGTVAHDLTLEVTESVFIHDPKRAQLVLSDLKALGVLIALDDFGTGYSSLSFLKHFPVDSVKIDRIFTADLVHDPASHAIASKMIELAHLLDLSVVTEGVETAAQRDEARHMGSEYYQGYYFARPMSAESLDELMTEVAAGLIRV